MKRAIIILLAAALLVCFVGCKKEAKKTTLTVAMSPDFAPMEFVDTSKTGQDQFVGFDITLANYIAQEMGLTLEIKPMSFDACQTAVQLGSVDMSISGFSWTAEREENFLLSDYYIAGDNETQQSVITVKAKEGTVTEPAGFAGWKVGAQAGEAIISNNPDIAFTGYDFEVDPKYENNVCLLNKNSTELLQKVNAALAKALAAGVYDGWYNDAKALAGISTASEVSYNDDGSAPTN